MPWGKICLLGLLSLPSAGLAQISPVNFPENKNCNDCNLRGKQLAGQDLQDTCVQRADLSFADLEGANIKEMCLNGTILKGANLLKTNLAEANRWQKARFCDTDLPTGFEKYRNRDCSALALEEQDLKLCTAEEKMAVKQPMIKAKPLSSPQLQHPPFIIYNKDADEYIYEVTVWVQVYINTLGGVSCTRIIRSAGAKEFDEISRQAVAKMSFSPATNPDPVMTTAIVPITFKQ